MAWVAVAVGVGSAAVGAYSSSKASKAQASAAGDASQAQLAASREANALQRDMYDQNRQDSEPWRQSGTAASNQLSMLMGLPGYETGVSANATNPNSLANQPLVDLSTGVPMANEKLYATNADYRKMWDAVSQAHFNQFKSDYTTGSNGNAVQAEMTRLMQPYIDAEQSAQTNKLATATKNADFGKLSKSFTMSDFNADPGYQFRQDEGNKGIERSAAARGGQLSGATMKALARFGQDTASNEYQNSYNRFNNDQSTQFNRLSGIAGTGQQQVNALGQAGQNYAGAVGNNTMNAANNVANNTIGAGNARAASYMSTANGINNAIGTGVNAWQQQNALSSMNNMGGYTPNYSFSGARLGN
ncbi:MAG: hypothetical protein WC710_14855 [Gallionella sp.]|jgi:hypothetical protein